VPGDTFSARSCGHGAACGSCAPRETQGSG
jgi:hypothetical protein